MVIVVLQQFCWLAYSLGAMSRVGKRILPASSSPIRGLARRQLFSTILISDPVTANSSIGVVVMGLLRSKVWMHVKRRVSATAGEVWVLQ